MEYLALSFSCLLYIHVSVGSSFERNPCKDWVAFKTEKCIRLVAVWRKSHKEDAENICKTVGEEIDSEDIAKLITVKTEEKQMFIQKLLFENFRIFDNIWLGLELGPYGDYSWNDGTELDYTNWSEDNDDDYGDNDRKCVQMDWFDINRKTGKWNKANCMKANVVVCEKTQPKPEWQADFPMKLENMLQKIKQESEKNRLELEKTKQEFENEIANLKGNPVPVGFIYVQLPGKDSPTKLWPQVKWKNVGSEYAGLFFRVEGGGAAPYGQEQSDNTRRLAEVFYSGPALWTDPVIPSNGSWSGYAYTGTDGGTGKEWGLRFRLTNGEVRPRNKSVKIWQRIK